MVFKKMRKAAGLVLLILFSFLSTPLAISQDRISIASFNLYVFGPAKAEKEAVRSAIATIIRNFDLVAVQEIRDREGTAIMRLMQELDPTGSEYALLLSPRLGRTTSKEQYAFIYRTSILRPEGTPLTWEDAEDRFEREPFMAKFKTMNGNFDFVLVNIHTKPEDAAREIALLTAVMRTAAARYDEPDVICLGDWNADGTYFNETELSALFPEDHYLLLINNAEDTTIAAKSNTYDRMIATSTLQEDWTGSAGTFRFDTQPWFIEQNLKPTDVSDHYPIWAVFSTEDDTD
jgi:deoxyribonuclease-1-like protein